jgi:uncharacterized protein involved in outer membrane biogenesis
VTAVGVSSPRNLEKTPASLVWPGLMRAARLLAAGVAGLLAAGVAAAWLLPPLLDWDRYRDAIAVLASDRLGREVRIAGPVSLTLLPKPVLTAAGVSLAEAGDGIAIRAAKLQLRVAPLALAAGHIDAEELVLRGAEIHLPWPFRPIQIAATAPGWFAAASVRVEDSRLSIGDVAFTGLRATLTADRSSGSVATAGVLRLSGRPWQFTARLARPGEDGTARFEASLDGRGPVQGIGATLAGQIEDDGTFGGRLTGRGPDLSQLLPAPPVAFTAGGRVTMADGLATVDDLAGDIAGAPAQGAAALRVAPALRLDVVLAVSRLDLDLWLPALLRGGMLPFPASLDLSAEAAPLAGGTLRQVHAAVAVNGNDIAVRAFRAVLPGEAALSATGQVQRQNPGGAARFEGDVTLSAPALRPALAWLEAAGVVPGGLPEEVLHTADATAHAVLEPGRLILTGLDGHADGSHLSGSLDFRTAPAVRPRRDGDRPALTAVVQADRLELDPWLPAAWPALADIPARLKRMDADLQLAAAQLVVQGAPLGPATLDAAIEGGRMTLRRLELSAGGARATASGTLGEGGRIADGRLDIAAPSAATLAGSLPAAAGPLREMARSWRGPAALSMQAAGPPEALALLVAGKLGDLRLEAEPLLDLRSGNATGVLMLRHPGMPRLAESLGLPGAPGWLGDGSFSLVAHLSAQRPAGKPGRIAAEPFDLSAASLRASGGLALEGIGDPAAPPRLSGRIVADTLPLPLPDPRSSETLPFGALAGWQAQVKLEAAHVLAGAWPVVQQAAATLALADGKLRLDGLSGRVGDGALSGSASLDETAEPPALALEARMTGCALTEPLFDLPVDIAGGRLDASLSLRASGRSPAALLSALSGEARLAGSDGTLAGVSLGSVGEAGAEEAVRKALEGGSTAFSRLDLALRAEHGVLEVTDGRMTGPAGTARLTGTVDLAGNAAELRLGLLPAVTDPQELGVVLSGKLDALRREPDLAAVARWRAEHGGAE